MTFHRRLSDEFDPSAQLHKVWQQQHGVGLEEEIILSGKVDLASQRLNQDIHRGEVEPKFPQWDMVWGVCSWLNIIYLAECNLPREWFINFLLGESWRVQLRISLYSTLFFKTFPLDPHQLLMVFCGLHWMYYYLLQKVFVCVVHQIDLQHRLATCWSLFCWDLLIYDEETEGKCWHKKSACAKPSC